MFYDVSSAIHSSVCLSLSLSHQLTASADSALSNFFRHKFDPSREMSTRRQLPGSPAGATAPRPGSAIFATTAVVSRCRQKSRFFSGQEIQKIELRTEKYNVSFRFFGLARRNPVREICDLPMGGGRHKRRLTNTRIDTRRRCRRVWWEERNVRSTRFDQRSPDHLSSNVALNDLLSTITAEKLPELSDKLRKVIGILAQ